MEEQSIYESSGAQLSTFGTNNTDHIQYQIRQTKHALGCNCMSETETNKHNATTNRASITVPEFKATTDVKVTYQHFVLVHSLQHPLIEATETCNYRKVPLHHTYPFHAK